MAAFALREWLRNRLRSALRNWYPLRRSGGSRAGHGLDGATGRRTSCDAPDLAFAFVGWRRVGIATGQDQVRQSSAAAQGK